MIATSDSRTAKETQKTYLSIKQPPFRPPPYVFGPAWTLLYGLMGYAAHRAITAGLNPLTSTPQLIKETKHSATLYTIQLGLNRKHCSSFSWGSSASRVWGCSKTQRFRLRSK